MDDCLPVCSVAFFLFILRHWGVSCTSVPFLFCSILLFRFHFTHFKEGFFKCSANQSNLVSGSSPEVGPGNTSFPSFLRTYHLSQLAVLNTIYLIYFEMYVHWGLLDKDWAHCSIKPLYTNVRKKDFLIILLQFLFPHLNYFSGRTVKGKVQIHIYEEVIVGSFLNKRTLLIPPPYDHVVYKLRGDINPHVFLTSILDRRIYCDAYVHY
jgi:hypothetical protein